LYYSACKQWSDEYSCFEKFTEDKKMCIHKFTFSAQKHIKIKAFMAEAHSLIGITRRHAKIKLFRTLPWGAPGHYKIKLFRTKAEQ
jgi:hypothetical protein